MSSKNEILGNIKKNIGTKYEMPNMDAISGIQYADKIEQFINTSKFVGGNAILLGEGEDINNLIRSLYPEAKNISTNLPQITIANSNPDEVSDPRQLDGTDLGIIKGEIGVAENGCVWIPKNVKEKAIFFISEFLVVILDKNKLVNNMHEAYAKIDFHGQGYGVFISGPSKTADIEQSLVVGAHGARGLTVILE